MIVCFCIVCILLHSPTLLSVSSQPFAFLLVLLLVSINLVFDKDESHTYDWFEIDNLPIPCVYEECPGQLPELLVRQPLD